MGLGKIAITGIRKVGQMAADVAGRKLKNKALRGVVRTVNAVDNAGAAIGRGASRLTDAAAATAVRASAAADKKVFGPIGKATRDASSKALNSMRGLRTRPRETMGQINRRKGIKNPVYTPKTQVDQHVKDRDMHIAKKMFKEQGFGKIWNKPRPPKENNIRWEGNAGGAGKPMPNKITRVRGKDNVMNMREYPAARPSKQNVVEKYVRDAYSKPFDRSKLSTEYIKPSYTSKQVLAGKRVVGGAAAVGGAGIIGHKGYSYFKQKRGQK